MRLRLELFRKWNQFKKVISKTTAPMSLLKAKSSRTREKRLDTLNAWQGNVSEAVTELQLFMLRAVVRLPDFSIRLRKETVVGL